MKQLDAHQCYGTVPLLLILFIGLVSLIWNLVHCNSKHAQDSYLIPNNRTYNGCWCGLVEVMLHVANGCRPDWEKSD